MTTISSQNPSAKLLNALFTSSARAAVLRIFMLDPRRSYYQRQLETTTGLALRAVQRELERFTSVNLLYRRMEGNRAYYHVDMDCPLFPELRNLFLKTVDDIDQLRGRLAMDESVRLLFVCESENRALVVTAGAQKPGYTLKAPFQIEVMSSPEFLSALQEDSASLEPFLKQGMDLFGRRDDVIWRRIELAGFDVQRRKGIP